MELSLEWPSAVSLELLRPLSPENFDNERQIRITADVDKLSRSELAGKLLDHFDEQHQEESEPFDWFANEKSAEIPIFESLPSPPYKTDLKPPSQANLYPINAVDYQFQFQPLQPPVLSPSIYDPLLLSPLQYSPLLPQHFQSSPAVVPLAQSSPTLVLVPSTNSCAPDLSDNLKIECNSANAATESITSPSTNGTNSEWLKRETLTPPDSPKDEEILKMLKEFEPETLEHLVMARADELSSLAPTFDEEMPCQSPSAAYSDDGASSCSIASPYDTSDGGLDDPEWTPSTSSSVGSLWHSPSARGSSSRRNSSNKNNNYRASTKLAGSGGTTTASARRRATLKANVKSGSEERRQRKKEQNKNAATRYRLKKKAEVEEVKVEEQKLEEYNKQLKKQLEDILRESRYLKSLLREVYRKKGVIK